MFKYYASILGLSLIFLNSQSATAAPVCVSGCGDVRMNINQNLADGDNTVGKTLDSSVVSSPAKQIRYSAGQAMKWLVYSGGSIPTPNSYKTDWTYTKVDDYVSVALKNIEPCGVFYAPFNIITQNASDCSQLVYSEGQEVKSEVREYQTRIRVDKKIVTGVYSNNILVAEIGRCQPINCASRQLVIDRIYLNVNITVPQSCEINAGQVIDINFGNISSGAFKTAGVSAQGVQPQSRSIGVKCNSIADNAQLTLRLQADKTNGNIVVSDQNNDVGFRVTNNSGVPLIPNNLSSVIPFILDGNARQVTIQAVPVSVTGNQPTEGAVTSRAYLRVDFP
ncbi:spore coat protein U domain-containing protein [Serratia marcescens]|uniref:spore coat protein U domain-containing protein n=1 Tax=Serratia marcescens TaxID=615 RepID=UPI0038C0CCB2